MRKHTLKLLEVQPVEVGSACAYVNLRIDDLVIRGFKLIRRPDQSLWVAAPSLKRFRGQQGAAYEDLIKLPVELKKRVDRLVLEAWGLRKIRPLPKEVPGET